VPCQVQDHDDPDVGWLERVVLLVALVLLLPTVPASPAAQLHERTFRCHHKHEHVLEANARSVVYEKESVVYGCAFGQTRDYELGENAQSSSGGLELDVRALEGVIVAYEEVHVSRTFEPQAATPESRTSTLDIRSLRNGRRLFEAEGGALALVLKRDGAAAWITEHGGERGTYRLHARDRTGMRLLAEGTDIEPRSLRLNGNTLHWTQGGRSLSAELR
jgi:hypothetical protein